MWRSRGLVVADAALVVLLAGSAQWVVWTSDSWEGGRPVHAVLLALVTVPLLVRRRWPLPVVLVVGVASWLQYELGAQAPQPWFALLLALYAVGAHAGRRAARAGLAVGVVLLLAADVPRLLAGDPLDEVLPGWVVVVGTWSFGRWVRRRRYETHELVERARAAQEQRDERAAQAVADERARIARELHDLVAHSMGVIVIQAQAGQRSLEHDPVLARRALESVEQVGRQGLGEMRRLLELLTGADEGGVAPQPGLAQLGELVEQVRAAGLDVALRIEGSTDGLPAGVDLAGYRIVQEALTNVLKHARARSARVTVRAAAGVLALEVVDDGAGPAPAPVPGRGLVGMRERASLYGGEVTVDAAPGGGCRVRARLDTGRVPA